MYVYEKCRAIRKSDTIWKNILGSYITNGVVSSAVLEYCIALGIYTKLYGNLLNLFMYMYSNKSTKHVHL